MPKSGIYLFSWTSTSRKVPGEHSYDIWNYLKVNGQTIASSVSESDIDTEDQQGSATVVIHCTQGDAVWTSSCCHGHDIWGNSDKTTIFTGVLLYAD